MHEQINERTKKGEKKGNKWSNNGVGFAVLTWLVSEISFFKRSSFDCQG